MKTIRKFFICLLALMMFSTTGCTSKPTTSNEDNELFFEEQTNSPDTLNNAEEETIPIQDDDSNELIIEIEQIGEEVMEEIPMEPIYESYGLTFKQWNSIAVMNDLLSMVQEIHSFKDNRLFLEETYNKLLSNYKQSRIDGSTLNEVLQVLDDLEKYKMIDEKRERLGYIYEQDKARALKQAIPNPVSLVAAVQADNLVKTAASLLFMAIDSKNRYDNYKDSLDLKYLQDGWELDDKEKETLHNSLKAMYDYTNRMVNGNSLPDEFALTIDQINYFVDIASQHNNTIRIQDLERSQQTFWILGEYWMVLAECYYNEGEYKKCLDAVDSYFSLGYDIYKRDCRLSEVLPYAVVSASKCYSDNEYTEIANKYADMIIQIRSEEKFDWKLCYFAAQTYISIYAETQEPSYLEKAYEVVKASINRLIGEQRNQNENYLSNLDLIDTKKLNGKEKSDAENYNKLIKEERKTALPPIYEPLVLNLEMLKYLVEALEKPTSERTILDRMYHDNPIFLNKKLDEHFIFGKQSQPLINNELVSIVDKGREVRINASILSPTTKITTFIKSGDSITTIDDWNINSVNRKKNSTNIEEYTAIYKSKDVKKYKYNVGDVITVSIVLNENNYQISEEHSFKLVKKYPAGWVFETVK